MDLPVPGHRVQEAPPVGDGELGPQPRDVLAQAVDDALPVAVVLIDRRAYDPEQLTEPYRAAAEAFNRYLMLYGGITDGDTIVQMFVDLADLWERAAVDGTPVSDLVGDDPVEFAETFAESYGGRRWIDKERQRLIQAVDAARRGERR